MNELEDFEGFLDPEFNKFKFANDLLLGTNEHDCENLDIETSIKKLSFDLDEVEKRMTKLSSNHYEDLVSNFQDIENTNKLMKSKIGPNLERVNNSFNKINTEIIQPYEESVKMNQALKKIHTTLDLLRGSNFFFLIILQIEELEKFDEEKKKSNDIVKLCRMYKQINDLLDDETKIKNRDDHNKFDNEYIKDDISLLSIRIIREYQPIHTSKYHQLNETLTSVINNEFNHSGKFQTSNSNLKNHLIGYFVLEGNILKIVERTSISKQIQSILNQLTRSLQTPRNFNQIINEVNEESTNYLSKLTKILKQCEVFDNNNGNEDNQKDITINPNSLYDILIKEFGQELNTYYWTKVLTKFKTNLKSTMTRGGPIAKNLKIYYNGIRNSINEVFKNDELKLFLETIETIQK